jgi:acyl-CoA thioester hydrolase
VTDDLRHRTPIQVRFRDTDAFGHVNNAVFFTYIELARVRYLVDVLELEGPFERMPLILARVELDFRSPILFGEEVDVTTQVDRIGRSSIAMSHRLSAGADRRLVGESQSVLVTYDYEAAAPIPVPDDWRAKLAAHEGRNLDRAAAAMAAG